MSQENVEIALAVYEVEGDVAAIPRDDELWAAWTGRVAPYFDPHVEIHIGTGVEAESDTFTG